LEIKHFKDEEFYCPCCNLHAMDEVFTKRLDIARGYARVPFVLTSAYRCANYQEVLRTHGKQTAIGVSPHEKGMAVDIGWTNETRYKILDSLRKVGFTRFGFDEDYVHVDMDTERKQKYIWYYLH